MHAKFLNYDASNESNKREDELTMAVPKEELLKQEKTNAVHILN